MVSSETMQKVQYEKLWCEVLCDRHALLLLILFFKHVKNTCMDMF